MANSNARDNRRTLIVWEIPATGSNKFVEMFLNPEQLTINDKKLTQKVRTKGGYILQYWGEDLTQIQISGKAGHNGIEGINVLHDIYRSEQIALQALIRDRGSNVKRRQSIAQLATSVVMWYQGQGYRGFFESFGYTEVPSGFITYNISFTAVEKIGTRRNAMKWQRKPWSDLANPVSLDSPGGGYGFPGIKLGPLNAPVHPVASNVAPGELSDPQFTEASRLPPSQEDLEANLNENNPSNLFAPKPRLP